MPKTTTFETEVPKTLPDDVFALVQELGPRALLTCLPPRHDPDFLPKLVACISLDMQRAEEEGIKRRVQNYVHDFPELQSDSQLWDMLNNPRSLSASTPSIEVDPFETPVPDHISVVGSDLAQTDAVNVGSTLAKNLPEIGSIISNFRILERLGQGGFGTVFLAEQIGLGNRKVALKFTTQLGTEPELLANLQHTNIVPVFSVHQHKDLQVLCMPFRGRHTLADALSAYQNTRSLPRTGEGLLTTRLGCKDQTVIGKKPLRTEPKSKALEFQPVREMLAKLSYPKSVVWLMTRLAEGLDHAHKRNILHLDIKPANVLISDEGMPMLLDFGLAHDMLAPTYAMVGGTVRYMAPEQLDAIHHRAVFLPDARMDLYALGLIFYELISGHHPYEEQVSTTENVRAFCQEKRLPPIPVTHWNREIEPGVQAIVHKLLAPKPEDRYQTAEQLVTDLERHQQDLPLKYAANPSLKERVQKYRRRHPARLMAMIACVLGFFASVSMVYAVKSIRAEQAIQAQVSADDLTSDIHQLRIDLVKPQSEEVRQQALAKVKNWYEVYPVATDPQWQDRVNYKSLTATEQEKLQESLQELALLAAHSLWQEQRQTQDETRQEELLTSARQWNLIAQQVALQDTVRPAIADQRILLDEKFANTTNPDTVTTSKLGAKARPLDYYLSAVQDFSLNRVDLAKEKLEELVENEPAHGAAHYLLGIIYQSEGQVTDALERYQLAKVLAPKDYRAGMVRGHLLLMIGEPKAALREFTEVVKRKPDYAEAYYHRGLANLGLHNYALAEADFTVAIEKGIPKLRGLLSRSSAYELLKKPQLAQADRDEAELCEPKDEMDFVARGCARYVDNPKGALDDFFAAAKLNPNYLHAWQNTAVVLSESFHEYEQAIDALDKALKASPGFIPSKAGQAVLYARIGQHKKAQQLAEEVLLKSNDGIVIYQMSCVYAIQSNGRDEAAKVALELFRKSIRSGYHRLDEIRHDADHRNISHLEEYQAILKAAESLYQAK